LRPLLEEQLCSIYDLLRQPRLAIGSPRRSILVVPMHQRYASGSSILQLLNSRNS
jgi:hypothetical protein